MTHTFIEVLHILKDIQLLSQPAFYAMLGKVYSQFWHSKQ